MTDGKRRDMGGRRQVTPDSGTALNKLKRTKRYVIV